MTPTETSRFDGARLAAVVCSFGAAILWAGPFLARADLFADDAAQHIFWLYRYADPELFPGDLTARFFSLPSSAPWGYRALYAAIAPFADVLFSAEVLAFALLLVSATLAWAIGRAVTSMQHRDTGGLVAVVALLVLLAQPSDLMTPLALQRTFALPMVLLFLFAAVTQRYVWLGVTFLLAAAFYPVVIVVLGLSTAVLFVRELVRLRRIRPVWIWNIVAGAVALATIVLSIGVPDDIGPTISGAQAMAMPEFGPAGRLQLTFGSFRGDWLRSQLLGLGWPTACLLAIAAAVGFVALCRKRLPAEAWILLASGLLTWAVARMFLFTLYLPNRHSRWAIAAFAICAFAIAAVGFLERLARWERQQKWLRWALPPAAVALCLALYLPTAIRTWSSPVDGDMERAYAFLGTLPKDTLIASHPDVADFIPLRSRRSVLASTETSLPFMQEYYAQLKPRLEASLRAAYATNWRDVDSILVPLGVRVVVSSPAIWSRRTYFEPFAGLVASLRARGEADGFALRDPPPERVLFRSGDVYVLRVEDAGVR